MAHSYIEAHEDEYSAFREYVALYPETVLLVDTYDTLHSVREVVRLARELGPEFRVSAIRLDSGDIATLAKDARQILDEGGLPQVEIFVSGSLDEYIVAELLEKDAPIDAFRRGHAHGHLRGRALRRQRLQAGRVRRARADEALDGQDDLAGTEASVSHGRKAATTRTTSSRYTRKRCRAVRCCCR